MLNLYLNTNIHEKRILAKRGLRRIVLKFKKKKLNNSHLAFMKINLAAFESLVKNSGCYLIIFGASD